MRKFTCFFAFFVVLLTLIPTFSFATDVSARSAVLLDARSDRVIYEKNKDEPMPMASTTKIMTAIVVLESCPLDKIVKIDERSVGIEGSSIYLKSGETLTVKELLYALLLESANDASVALAIATCGSEAAFVEKMNEKAQTLGLTSTHFTNPHGLYDEEHYTTAYELAVIADYALKNQDFAQIVGTKKMTIPLNNGEGTRILINHNRLLRSFEGVNGVKTGFTKKSGRCLVSSAEIDGTRLICVTLNAPNDWRDHTSLLSYGFDRLESFKLAEKGSYLIEIPVVGGKASTVLATNGEELTVTLEKGENNICAHLITNSLICAPLSKTDTVGKIVFYNNGEEIGEISLYPVKDVYKQNYKKSLFEGLFN